jgi:exodeoxyribonuclease VII large subunit
MDHMSQGLLTFAPERKIYSVVELSLEIKGLLEKRFPDVWVAGEVSNFHGATSGHFYLTLKDDKAQIRAVCFRNQARYLKFKPQDGISVIARGHLGVYEARGEYQLYVDYLEPAGIGALQLAFDQLKEKLAAEGLFDAARKRPLPALPHTVGVVTSPTGAVIRDILRVLKRRYSNMNVLLYPVKVQGEGAAGEIAEGIEYFSKHHSADVLILARGGGSLEDLWAFNEESVARAIAASRIPVISAVGHETDFTIADFVADLRAPTPSAAAEVVVHRKQDFIDELRDRARRMTQSMRLVISEARERLAGLRMHYVFKAMLDRVGERARRVDDAIADMTRRMREKMTDSREALLHSSAGIVRYDFRRALMVERVELDERQLKLQAAFARLVTERRNRLLHIETLLTERSPRTILDRGYSITRDANGYIVRDAAQVAPGDELSIRIARGELGATVQRRKM